ncbi:hypothetical protein [Sulfitobacter aestuariivivens]|uniref:Uncharacterized protein n=1 Tax=Sulfitobacter aestuariivivens TaxID=2766981 RepID=A0A927D4G5_9RHOB|nr:hypothetical protein [Sulfitobacter aestuariivivens]MBD3664865.1 hypothetical protein [Sulfitobacter aestuariivivens]
MDFVEKYYVPLVTAIWMICLPFVFMFFAGAGAETVFDWLSQLSHTIFAVFGGPSVIFGALLLVWTVWRGWRNGDLIHREA